MTLQQSARREIVLLGILAHSHLALGYRHLHIQAPDWTPYLYAIEHHEGIVSQYQQELAQLEEVNSK